MPIGTNGQSARMPGCFGNVCRDCDSQSGYMFASHILSEKYLFDNL